MTGNASGAGDGRGVRKFAVENAGYYEAEFARIEGRTGFAVLARQGDAGFDWLADRFGGAFDGITQTIRWVLDGLEVLLIQTP